MDEYQKFLGGGGDGGGGSGGGGGGKSASSSASSASAINFGGAGGLVSESGGLTPLAGVILGAIGLIAFVVVIVVARR